MTKKNTNTNNLEIYFGALCDPIYKQIKDQGLRAPKKEFELFEKLSHSISMLRIHGLLPDGQVRPLQKKLFKKILGKVKDLNPKV